jgi:hypothetical protein
MPWGTLSLVEIMKSVVLLANLFNIIDLITTYICMNKSNCYEWNKFAVHYPTQFYITKIIAIPVLTLVLYKLTHSNCKLISDTAKLLLFMITYIYLLAVINNINVLLIAYRWGW